MLPDLERNPKMPPCKSNDMHTLVLDFDETLIHYFELDSMGQFSVAGRVFQESHRVSFDDYLPRQSLFNLRVSQCEPHALLSCG